MLHRQSGHLVRFSQSHIHCDTAAAILARLKRAPIGDVCAIRAEMKGNGLVAPDMARVSPGTWMRSPS